MEIRCHKKAVTRHAMSNSSGPYNSSFYTVFFLGTILLALINVSQAALAVGEPDQLYVTGVIKSINASTGLVTVDVKSSSCHGMRIFKADNLDKLKTYVEQRVSFFIDSSICNVKETYTIITARGLRKWRSFIS